jgi:hypothetical protein
MNFIISKNMAVTAASILLISGPLFSEMRAFGLDEFSGLTEMLSMNPLKPNTIVLAVNENGNLDDQEKTTSGSESKSSDPESKSTTDDKKDATKEKSKPLKPFVPSEKIPGEQAVDFPVDI